MKKPQNQDFQHFQISFVSMNLEQREEEVLIEPSIT